MQLLSKFLCSLPVVVIIALSISPEIQAKIQSYEGSEYLQYILSSIEKAAYTAFYNMSRVTLQLSPFFNSDILLTCSGYTLSASLGNLSERIALPFPCSNFTYLIDSRTNITVSFSSGLLIFR